MSKLPFGRNPAWPSRPVVPPNRRPLISPGAWASAWERYDTVIVPIIKEAIKTKQVDDMVNLLSPEKKDATPGSSTSEKESNEHPTMTYSLLEGLEPEHLPWSKEVHLVEIVNGVRKTYSAVVVVLRKFDTRNT